MNRYLALGCLGLGLMVSPLLGALRGAESAVPSNPKVGIIDTQKLFTTPAGKRAFEQLEKSRKQKQVDIDKRTEEFKKARVDLEKQRPILKEEVYKQKNDELAKKAIELQETYVKFERELAMDDAKASQALSKLAEPQIEKIAKAEGVTVILERGAVVWAEPTVNLTDKLLAEMK